MRPRVHELFTGIVALSLVACSGETLKDGVDEPIRVHNAQFFKGALPGTPPLTPEEIAAGAVPETPLVTSVDGASGSVRYGDPQRAVRGRVSSDAFSVGVRFAELGSGYWVSPVSSPDPQYPGEYTFVLNAELSRDLPPGQHELEFVAIGKDGAAGTHTRIGLCVPSAFPDNQNACFPKREPPKLVVSLAWDVESDLDLQVLTPDGLLIDAKNPTGAPDDTQQAAAKNATAGRFERDSNAACGIDGIRVENVVFNDPAPSGEYSVYANLFDACQERVTRFTLSVLESASGEEPDTFTQVERIRRSGSLLDVQANGGAQRGLFVTKFIVP